MVTLFQPNAGMCARPAKRCGVQPDGERPDALSPVRPSAVPTIANASLPTPLLFGSTTVSVIAVVSAASTALPPRRIASRPATAAKGCDVATTLRATTGMRCEGYGNCQSITTGAQPARNIRLSPPRSVVGERACRCDEDNAACSRALARPCGNRCRSNACLLQRLHCARRPTVLRLEDR